MNERMLKDFCHPEAPASGAEGSGRAVEALVVFANAIIRAFGSLPYNELACPPPHPNPLSQSPEEVWPDSPLPAPSLTPVSDVTLFEKRPFLGGRASSWEHPGTGEVVDNCQHVLFRVCTNLIEFYQRIGVADQIRWYDEMTFIEPGGRTSVMKSSSLPAPLHTAPSFLHFPFLGVADKLAIARALVPLTLSEQYDTGQSFQHWLDQHGQTKRAVDRFWHPILVSALSEDLDLISISAAAQVVRESMKSPEARHMGVPTVPLTDLYNAAGDYVRARGGALHFRRPLESFIPDPTQVTVRPRSQNDESNANQEEVFDYLILALPFDALDRVLPAAPESVPLREDLNHFETAPITGIHLWFDRQISDLDHAVLLDRTIQWMFHKSRLQPMRSQAPSPAEVVLAAERRENAAHGASRGTGQNEVQPRRGEKMTAPRRTAATSNSSSVPPNPLSTNRAPKSLISPSARSANSSPPPAKPTS